MIYYVAPFANCPGQGRRHPFGESAGRGVASGWKRETLPEPRAPGIPGDGRFCKPLGAAAPAGKRSRRFPETREGDPISLGAKEEETA